MTGERNSGATGLSGTESDEQAPYCLVSHGKDAEGQPRTERATRGHLCRNHATRLAGMLRDIATDYTLLPTVLAPGQTGGNERRSKGDEAPVPINLHVAALRDAERGGAPRDYGDELWYELPDLPSVPATIHLYAETIRVTLDPTREAVWEVKDANLIAEIRLLLNAIDTLTALDQIDEAFADVKRAWAALQSAHGRPRPRTLGRCLNVECDGPVRERPNTHPWCSTCRRVYDSPAEWARIAIEEQRRKAKPA